MVSARNFFTTFEFRRKAVHLLLGISIVIFINLEIGFVQQYSRHIFLALLIFMLGLSIICKYTKFSLLVRFLEIFDKPKDLKEFPAKGSVFYLIGTLASLLLFDLKIASASIIILAVGDPLAHFVGRYYGKTKLIINNKKLLEGTLAGTFFGTFAAMFFVPWPIAFFGAAFGMIAEAVELETLHLDDNFFIPLVSGAVMTLIGAFL